MENINSHTTVITPPFTFSSLIVTEEGSCFWLHQGSFDPSGFLAKFAVYDSCLARQCLYIYIPSQGSGWILKHSHFFFD